MLITISYVKENTKKGDNKVEYRYIPKSFYDEQFGHIDLNKTYDEIFMQSNPGPYGLDTKDDIITDTGETEFGSVYCEYGVNELGYCKTDENDTKEVICADLVEESLPVTSMVYDEYTGTYDEEITDYNIEYKCKPKDCNDNPQYYSMEDCASKLN